VAGRDEIKMWVLILGPEAKILEPERVLMMARENLARTLARYGTEKDVSGAISQAWRASRVSGEKL